MRLLKKWERWEKLSTIIPEIIRGRFEFFCFALGHTSCMLSASYSSFPGSVLAPQKHAALHRLSPFSFTLRPPHACLSSAWCRVMSSPTLGSSGCSHTNLFPTWFLVTPCHSLRKQQGKLEAKRSQLQEGSLSKKEVWGRCWKLQMEPPFGCSECGGFAWEGTVPVSPKQFQIIPKCRQYRNNLLWNMLGKEPWSQAREPQNVLNGVFKK